MEPFSVVVQTALVFAQIIVTWKHGFLLLDECIAEAESDECTLSLRKRHAARRAARGETFVIVIVNASIVFVSNYLMTAALHRSLNPIDFVTVPVGNVLYELFSIESNWHAQALLSAMYLLAVAYLLAACSSYARQMIESSCDIAYFSARHDDPQLRLIDRLRRVRSGGTASQ